MLLDDITDYLTTGGMGTVTKDFLPDAPATVITVYGTGGQAPTYTMAGRHVMEQPRIQVVCRAESLQTAHQNAKGVYELLSGVRNRTINSVLYHWIEAVQEPFLLGRDGNARFTVACNYDVKKDRST
jgi:hypothetical protein